MEPAGPLTWCPVTSLSATGTMIRHRPPPPTSPSRKTDVALGELDLIRSVRAHADAVIAPRLLGVLQTTWGDASNFIRAYNGDASAPASSAEAAVTFKALFSAIRATQ